MVSACFSSFSGTHLDLFFVLGELSKSGKVPFGFPLAQPRLDALEKRHTRLFLQIWTAGVDAYPDRHLYREWDAPSHACGSKMLYPKRYMKPKITVCGTRALSF